MTKFLVYFVPVILVNPFNGSLVICIHPVSHSQHKYTMFFITTKFILDYFFTNTFI